MTSHATTAAQDRVEAEVEGLMALGLHGLRDAWPPRFGPPPKLRSPDLVRRMLAWRLQAELSGGLDAETRRLLAKPPTVRRTTMLPLGTRVVREWKGERHEAEMSSDGVRYRGETYASLSEVARVITGVRRNGPRFFGLRAQS